MTISQKASLWCVALIVGGVLVLAWTDERDQHFGREEALRQQLSIAYAKYAEAYVDAEKKDTVWRVAKARLDSIVDTIPLWRHDTTYITAYVERSQSALRACYDLSESCAAFRKEAAANSLRHLAIIDSLLVERRPRFRDRFGVMCGYGAQIGGQVRTGVQCTAGVRVWPR